MADASDQVTSGRAGTLYVVTTPIGNLADASARMVDTLRGVAVIAAEDTRRTRALLTHFSIRGPEVSKLDAHSPEHAISRVVEQLKAGRDVAVVTDAGTPSVSDPGTAIVRLAADSGIRVVAIPGPSAVTAAIAVSGLVDGPFLFLGFLPRKGEKRRRAIARVAASSEPVVLFEAPNRIRATLAELAEAAPDRSACLARELTKMHEEACRGTLAELAASSLTLRGEMTLVIAPGPLVAEDLTLSPEELDAEIHRRLSRGERAKAIAAELSAAADMPRRDVYARVVSLSDRSPREH